MDACWFCDNIIFLVYSLQCVFVVVCADKASSSCLRVFLHCYVPPGIVSNFYEKYSIPNSMTVPAIPGLSRVSSAEDWNNHIARLSLNPTYHNSNTGYTLPTMGNGTTQQYVPPMQPNSINYVPGQSVHSIHSNIPSVNSELDKLHAQNLSDGNLSTMDVDMSSPYKRGRASTALSNRSISVSTNMMEDFGL